MRKASMIRNIVFWLIGKFDFPSLVADGVSYHQGRLGVNKIQNYYADFTFEETEI